MPCEIAKPAWPQGKRFAFTIVDDTDKSTVQNVGPVYDFLSELGLRTTKTIWPIAPLGPPRIGGQSLEDPDYRLWVLGLKDRGFEIALHGASDETSTRERVLRGLNYFREVIGQDPRLHANHTGQVESIYWGRARLDGVPKVIYQWAWRLTKGEDQFHGQREGGPYFWGDLCRDRIMYVRNLVFREINTLKVDPLMPYHDPRRPYVRYWFSSSDGASVPSFCRLISEANQDRLLEEGGACIAYTHFGNGFWRDSRLDPEFARLMRRLANLPGWFVPASRLLDYLGEVRGWQVVDEDRRKLDRMQWSWLLQKLRHGKS